MAIHTRAGIAGVDSGFGVTQSPVDSKIPNDLQVFLGFGPTGTNKTTIKQLGTTVERVRSKQYLHAGPARAFILFHSVVSSRLWLETDAFGGVV